MRKIAFIPLFVLASAASFAQYPGAAPVPEQFKKGFDAIKISDAKEWLGYLAGPECMGRGSLQPGYMKAAQYMADRFKEMGLKPAGDNGTYFQDVLFGNGEIEEGATFKVGDLQLTANGDNFMVNTSPTDGKKDVDANVALITITGGDTPVNFDELEGRVVIAQISGSGTSELRNKLRSSKAAAVFEVSDAITSTRRYGFQGNLAKAVIGRLNPSELSKVLTELGVEMPANGVKLVSKKAQISVTAKLTTQVSVNVVALLEGSDPELKKEYVGVGAHLDHVGVQKDRNGNEVVYWGADDDGSGSAAILAVAKGLTENPLKPKRSVLFMAFTAEEMGLIGSRYFANNPTIDLSKMICELQMDMVGRNSEGPQEGPQIDKAEENIDTIRLVGSKRISMELHDLIIEQNKYVNFRFMYDREDVYTRSDHYNFAAKGIPIAFLFDGFHPDYHQPTDTVDKINFEKLTNSAKLFYLTALQAANRDKPFAKDVKTD